MAKRARRALVRAGSLLAIVFTAGLARAAAEAASPLPIYVLSIWTDDADDQADALTRALRSQLKSAKGWSMLSIGQSFETLAIALRCPPKPDGACLQRIADQIHADHYVWGTMAKRADQVTADMHLFSRGAPQLDASATYSEGLTDPGQPALRVIAARLLSRLVGLPTTGTLIVRAGDASGMVVVDGREREALREGTALVTLEGGEHAIGVRVPGFEAPARTAWVTPNAQGEVDFALSPVEPLAAPPETPPSTAHEGLGARSILGYSAIAAGAGLLVVSAVEAANWIGDKNASDSDRQSVPRTVSDVCDDPDSAAAADACAKSKSAKIVSTIGWVFAAVGAASAATGVWLVATDSGASSDGPRGTGDRRSTVADEPRIRLLPEFGVHERSLDVRVTF